MDSRGQFKRTFTDLHKISYISHWITYERNATKLYKLLGNLVNKLTVFSLYYVFQIFGILKIPYSSTCEVSLLTRVAGTYYYYFFFIV